MDKIYVVKIGCDYESDCSNRVFFNLGHAVSHYDKVVKAKLGDFVKLLEIEDGDDLEYMEAFGGKSGMILAEVDYA